VSWQHQWGLPFWQGKELASDSCDCQRWIQRINHHFREPAFGFVRDAHKPSNANGKDNHPQFIQFQRFFLTK
jgi:hypothetical protein